MELGVQSVAVGTEDVEELIFDLGKEIDEFNERGENDGTCAGGAAGKFCRESEELIDRIAAFVVCYQMTEFAK